MLGDTLARTLPRLRAEAESRMRATCSITRPIGEPDPVTGEREHAPVWYGKCRVKSVASRVQSSVDVVTAAVTRVSDEVHIPVDVGPILVGDVITITAVEDPRLARIVGTIYRVTSLHEGNDTTAQRLPVERLA